MNDHAVRILPAESLEECFVNEGVFAALEYGFKNPEIIFGEQYQSLQPYKEMVRAYWYLALRIPSSRWYVTAIVDSEVAAGADNGDLG